jgi:hypothetical protein
VLLVAWVIEEGISCSVDLGGSRELLLVLEGARNGDKVPNPRDSPEPQLQLRVLPMRA